MMYQILKERPEKEIGMLFSFWGNVTLLKQEGTNKVFSKYHIKSKGTPKAPAGWKFEEHTFKQPQQVHLKKDEFINKVIDNLGNVYYEVTSII